MIRRLIPVWIVLAIALLLPSVAAAQDVRVTGQVLDRDGKPWAGLTVVIKSDAGRSFTLKTDNNGSFSQIGLTPGLYTVTVISQANNLNYAEKHQFSSGEDNNVTINFKAILAQIRRPGLLRRACPGRVRVRLLLLCPLRPLRTHTKLAAIRPLPHRITLEAAVMAVSPFCHILTA